MFEVLLLSALLAGTLLAFLRQGAYAACASAVTAVVTAYNKFSAPDKKLQRYSDAIAGIRSVLRWWRSLTDVEQASVANINDLVMTCEELFQAERQAWVSTAMANTKMLNAGGDEEEKKSK